MNDTTQDERAALVDELAAVVHKAVTEYAKVQEGEQAA